MKIYKMGDSICVDYEYHSVTIYPEAGGVIYLGTRYSDEFRGTLSELKELVSAIEEAFARYERELRTSDG